MKKLLLFVSVLALIFTSCSSDDDSSSTPILVAQITETEVYNGQTETYTMTFNYDGNKLLGIDYGTLSSTVTYTGNLITKLELFYGTILIQEGLYTYDSSERLINFKRFEYDSTDDYGVNVDYIYNPNGTVSFTKESGQLPDLNPSSTGVINFNSDGTVSTIVASTGYNYSYTYDSKNTPFKNVLGMDKLIFEDDEVNNNGIHNFLTEIEQYGSSSYTRNYTYSYNSNDFPVESTMNDGYSVVTKQYIYNQ